MEPASTPTPTKPRRRPASAPFIMPNGRPLGVFLAETGHERPSHAKKGTRRPGHVKAPKEGWTSAKAAQAAVRAAPTDGYKSDAERMEEEALNRVGQRRRRRWLNDKLLRDMAGTLTARDMEALFKPVPFGETGHASIFSRAVAPEHVQLWDLFRSVDMDKESRVLQKWEAHVRELQAGPDAIQSPAVDALAAWSGVSWKARRAMRRASQAQVEAIEAQLLGFVQAGKRVHAEGHEGSEGAHAAGGSRHGAGHGHGQGGGSRGASPHREKEEEEGPEEQQELVLELEDGFGRLVAHGLAEYHGLASHSRLDADGVKRVVVRRRRPGEAAAAAGEGAGPGPEPRAPLAISCSDILLLLGDHPASGLSSRALHDAFCPTPEPSPSVVAAPPRAAMVAAR